MAMSPGPKKASRFRLHFSSSSHIHTYTKVVRKSISSVWVSLIHEGGLWASFSAPHKPQPEWQWQVWRKRKPSRDKHPVANSLLVCEVPLLMNSLTVLFFFETGELILIPHIAVDWKLKLLSIDGTMGKAFANMIWQMLVTLHDCLTSYLRPFS